MPLQVRAAKCASIELANRKAQREREQKKNQSAKVCRKPRGDAVIQNQKRCDGTLGRLSLMSFQSIGIPRMPFRVVQGARSWSPGRLAPHSRRVCREAQSCAGQSNQESTIRVPHRAEPSGDRVGWLFQESGVAVVWYASFPFQITCFGSLWISNLGSAHCNQFSLF